MMLITPFIAFAPHRVAPTPLMTSILSTSSSITSRVFAYIPEYKGV